MHTLQRCYGRTTKTLIIDFRQQGYHPGRDGIRTNQNLFPFEALVCLDDLLVLFDDGGLGLIEDSAYGGDGDDGDDDDGGGDGDGGSGDDDDNGGGGGDNCSV